MEREPDALDRVAQVLTAAGMSPELAAHYRWVLDSLGRYGWDGDRQLAEQARWMVKVARDNGEL